MSTKLQTMELDFLGQKVVLKSEGDPEVVREAVEVASLRLKDVARRAPGATPDRVALLALLDLAEEYARAKRRASEHKKKLERRAQDLIQLVDAGLK
jgi:cell division protein ZapA (FtsZ GTPase activity inhibitor)